MTKRLTSIAALALALSAGAASAADLPSRKGPPMMPPPPPPPLWTGFYAGLNAGGTFGGSNSVTTSAAPLFFSPTWNTELAASSALASNVLGGGKSGFIGGGQIGYNWQFSNVFVAGVEADIQGIAGANGSTSAFGAAVPAAFPAETIVSITSVSRKLDYLGTVRGRLGYLITPTLLAYGTGGLAYGGANLNVSIFQNNLPFGPPFASVGSFSDTRVGWTAGGGLEWLFWPNWSAKVEYLYYDLGNVTVALNPLANVAVGGFVRHVSTPIATTRFDGHVVRAGLNYHFHWGSAPVVAKY
jgi:outer membrane immunogenic protein